MIALSKIDLEPISDPDELLSIGLHAGKVGKIVTAMTEAYSNFNNFPYMKAEFNSEDGYVHLRLSKDETEPSITFAPDDWNEVMIFLRDTYFQNFKIFAENLRKDAITKAYNIENPE